ncbi:4'-phosphopantetheinyl transferase family protein [Acinetobacter baumannii]|uniref:Enterobactin synthase component D n=4 Tax=Acinetobacter baumannii TaxID=470 RepID=A0AAD2U3J7_ACIBA|nr:4'-phosphopantetheinyl transferase superfamily protein [Acinetobacter baumannii]EGJ62226.1 hypothetical protein HMPREF0021_00027 [Acinetobacter baumannii 6013150]EGJ62650.1 hypothetical protein HMPREF0020_03653 [Acinetobacter baumannii 6013113]KLT83367.1 4'-phosphopantetheinyl transferase family protein [Acinetobacter baumannii MRSN 3527]KLT98721.1 4'-phosphopantetheinyl transferase family protein [Acinetobacter baumannii MRSN 3942]ALJ86095.1 4'-phosphopantetheinyl transferase entD [Acineto
MCNTNTLRHADVNIAKQYAQHKKLMFKDECLEYSILDIEPQSIHQIRILNMNEQRLHCLYSQYKIFMPFHVTRASLKRKSEFFIGRLAAQFALATLGDYTNFIIKKGERGEPLWPRYIRGSISHSMSNCTHGIAIATAAKHPTQFTDGITQSNSQYETQILGVDVEIKQNIEIFKENPNILNSLMSAQEHKQLIPFLPQFNCLHLIVFSAKESLIKAVYNKYQTLIFFEAIHCIGIQPSTNTLSFYIPQISSELSTGQIIEVNYLESEHEIITYCCLPISSNQRVHNDA